jgi:hypothetical protein
VYLLVLDVDVVLVGGNLQRVAYQVTVTTPEPPRILDYRLRTEIPTPSHTFTGNMAPTP